MRCCDKSSECRCIPPWVARSERRYITVGSMSGEAKTKAPYAIRQRAAIPDARRLIGSDFSAKISAVISAIAAMFIMPSGKRMTKSNQQQPRQYVPCSTPIRSAPPGPSRHEFRSQDMGERHFERQILFSGDNW